MRISSEALAKLTIDQRFSRSERKPRATDPFLLSYARFVTRVGNELQTHPEGFLMTRERFHEWLL